MKKKNPLFKKSLRKKLKRLKMHQKTPLNILLRELEQSIYLL